MAGGPAARSGGVCARGLPLGVRACYPVVLAARETIDWLPHAPTVPAPRTSVARWHLSRTRVTAAGLQHLLALPALELLDARGTGVPRAALLPLERRFGLPQPQAAVLARAALAAAAVGGALFPCCCAAGGVALAPAQARAAGAAAGAAAGRACEDAAAWQARGRGAGAGVVQAPLPVVGVRRRAGRQAGGSGDSLHQERDDGQAAMFRGIVTLLCA